MTSNPTAPAANLTITPFVANGAAITAVYVRLLPVVDRSNANVVGHLNEGQTARIVAKVTAPTTPAGWYQIAGWGAKPAYVAARYVEIVRDDGPCPDNALKVPYYSQIFEAGGRLSGWKACGPTSDKMLIEYYKPGTTDPIEVMAKKIGRWDQDTGWNDLIKLARLYNVELNLMQHDGTLEMLKASLAAKHPAIVLVDYVRLGFPNHLDSGPDQGDHFFVVIGMDDNTVFVNDPLWTPDQRNGRGGSCIGMDKSRFAHALVGGVENHIAVA